VASETNPLLAAGMTEALASLEDPRAADLLADLAVQMDSPAVAKAGAALSWVDDPRGRPLLESVQDVPAPAGPWARAALARPAGAGAPFPTPLLDELAPAPKVLQVPGSVGPDSTPGELLRASLVGMEIPARALTPYLESSRWSEYRPAALAVANSGSLAHLAVLRGLARSSRYDANGNERVTYNEEALRILGWLQDQASIPLFREVVASDSYGSPRIAAAWALGRLRDTASIPLLVASFSDASTPYRVRRSSAQALAHFADPQVGDLVLGQLESPDPRIRRLTVLLLGDSGAHRGSEQMDRLAEVDPDPELRRLAAVVARRLGNGS
jgi:HEAT repeat protein